MTPKPLVIVFGAGGRLGSRLLALLVNEPLTVLGVARDAKPANHPQGMHWIQFDVANPDEWHRSLWVLTDMARIHSHAVVVDLLLKRETVSAMRTSIAAVTGYVLRLKERLDATDQNSSLVAASTTAILAPWLYQTPYGLAKRRQLSRYVASPMSGTGFLLPSLTESSYMDSGTRSPLRWSYEEAARRLAAEITRQCLTRAQLRAPLSLVIPEPPLVDRTHSHGRPAQDFPLAVKRFFPTHLSLLLGRHDSPHAHREASHQRLALTPPRLRGYVDHHQAPANLVRRFRRYSAVPPGSLRRPDSGGP